MTKIRVICCLVFVLLLILIICSKSIRLETDMGKFGRYKNIQKPKHIDDTNNQYLLDTSFNLHNLQKFNTRYNIDPQNKIFQNAISGNPVKEILLENDRISYINHKFSNKISTKIKISDQKFSGRCWIFSFLNMFRYKIISELKLPETFEFSQNYLCFFDKLEKCYYFLQNVVKTKEEPLNSKRNDWLLKNTLSDGGNWNMLVNLINKYGIVPKNIMPETYQSGNTYQLNNFLKQNLKRMAYNIRNNNTNGVSMYQYLQDQIYFIYKLLVIFLGSPPEQFSWDYIPKGGKLVSVYNITPLQFSGRYFRFNDQEWVVCGNFPLNQYPFYHKYNINMCNNMIDGKNTEIFNLPVDVLMEVSKKSIDQQLPVWIAVDWSKYNSCEYSSLDIELYDFKRFGYKSINKGSDLEYKLAAPNHAVLIIGYNLDEDGKINRWLIDNSHGDEPCKLGKGNEKKKMGKGYLTMTNDWFKEYVYQVIAKREFLSKELIGLLEKPAVHLEPWEVIGCEVLKVGSGL